MNWLNQIDDILDRFLPASSTSTKTNDKGDVLIDKFKDLDDDIIKKDQEEILQQRPLISSQDKTYVEDLKTKKTDVYLMASNPLPNKRLPGTICKTKRRPRTEYKKEASLNELGFINCADIESQEEILRQNLYLNTVNAEVNRFENVFPQENQALSLDNNENHKSIHSDPCYSISGKDEKIYSPTTSNTEENIIQNETLSLPILELKKQEIIYDEVQTMDQKLSFNTIEETGKRHETTLPLFTQTLNNPTTSKIEETLLMRNESSSSELLDFGKDSASVAFDYVRNQAQSLRAVMGDLDYAFEQAIEDRDGDYDDSTSNMTEEEGEDYNYGDHIIPWSLDRIDQDSNMSLSDEFHSSVSEFHPSMNCHGVFHIRLIRGQHFPCTPKSTIQTIISLPPWKGKIKAPSGQTYKGPSTAGTCFRWSNQDSMNENAEESTCFSMIHTYNNEQTPVPTIMIQVKDVSYSMFEKDLFYIPLCCKPLMKRPCVWRRRWCIADSINGKRRNLDTVHNECVMENTFRDMTMPLILLEAVFEPTNFSDAHPKSVQFNEYDRTEVLAPDESSYFSESPNRRHVTFSEVSSVSSSTAGISIPTLGRKGLSSAPHLFRIASTWKPGHCSVCSVSTGLWSRYYQCEVCGLDCCNDCQLRVDLELPCGSEAAEIKVKQAKESKITFRRVMAILAPIGEEEQTKNTNMPSPKEAVETKTVGILKLQVHRAVLFQRTFSADIDIVDMYKIRDRWSRVGDYYIRISWSDGDGDNKRTKTVFQTSSPIFESDEIQIPVKTYGSEYLVEAIDANTDKAVGATLLTTQGILQWQRDELVSNEGIRFRSILSYPISPPTIKRSLELRAPWKHGFGLEFYKTGMISDTNQAGKCPSHSEFW